MLRTDHYEQDKPRREKELEEQEEAGNGGRHWRQEWQNSPKGGPREESPPWMGKDSTLGSAEDCVKVRETK